MILSHEIKNFSFGTIDTIDHQSIPEGAASTSLNWFSTGSDIQLRRGMQILGTDNGGTTGVQGLHVAYKNDGTQMLWRKRGRKLEYYDIATLDWIECGSNLFPAAAANDEASFGNYASLAGAQMFVCTPNSGPFKVMTANPGSYTDLTDASKNFQGYIRIKQNRMWLWGRLKDKTGVYGSFIDTAAYTSVSAEALASVASGTLAFKGGGSVRTCFAVKITVTGTGEVFTDNYDGTLTGSLGSTGTINYTTGDFTTTASGAGTCDYQWENSNNKGITDFTKSATRLAGEGFVFRQDDGGGAVMNVLSYGDKEYCMHEHKTWVLTLTQTDTNATNLIYRDKVGIPNRQAAVETGSGIFYIDNSDQADPQIRVLTLNQFSTDVIPVSVSKRQFHTRANAKGIKVSMTFGMELGSYHFDKAVLVEWGNYIVGSMRSPNGSKNDRIITYSKFLAALERHGLYANHLVVYNGNLVGGDSISDNCYTFFSGFTDDDSLFDNSWEGSLSDLQIDELKKSKKLILKGYIAKDQSYDVYISLDNSDYVQVGTIDGTGTYVDSGQATSIGATMVGESTIGGEIDLVNVYYYEHAIKLSLDKFNRAKMKVTATKVGYASINSYKFFDIRLKGRKILQKYR